MSSVEIAASVERTLREQARRNELMVARGRVVALALAALLDAAFYLFPGETVRLEYVSPANALLAGAWTIVALVLAQVLQRGWYRERLADLFPLLDGVIILTLYALITHSLEGSGATQLHPLVVVAAASTFLATTGALRLRRNAALWSTCAGIAVFVFASSTIGYTLAQTAFVCAAIACAGMLAARVATMVNRAVHGEAQKIILERFLPRELVEADPQAGLRLIAEPRTVEASVLVSDLRGFTAMAEAMTPSQTLELLNSVQGTFAEAVREQGGTVDKFMGDGMLAVFGAPQPLEQHARAALNTASTILERLEQLNAARGSSLKAGIGIHSGELLFGCLGSGARLEFTVLGDTVNTAARLQALTKERDEAVLASEATVRAAGASLAPLGSVALRGRGQPIAIYAMRSTARPRGPEAS